MVAKRVKAQERRINKILFRLCIFVTIIAVLMTAIRFFAGGEATPVGINVFYIGVLCVYAIHKEILRWMLEDEDGMAKEKNGEFFVYFWIILVASLYLIDFFYAGRFTEHEEGKAVLIEASFISLEVCAVFILTRIAKVRRLYGQGK